MLRPWFSDAARTPRGSRRHPDTPCTSPKSTGAGCTRPTRWRGCARRSKRRAPTWSGSPQQAVGDPPGGDASGGAGRRVADRQPSLLQCGIDGQDRPSHSPESCRVRGRAATGRAEFISGLPGKNPTKLVQTALVIQKGRGVARCAVAYRHGKPRLPYSHWRITRRMDE